LERPYAIKGQDTSQESNGSHQKGEVRGARTVRAGGLREHVIGNGR